MDSYLLFTIYLNKHTNKQTNNYLQLGRQLHIDKLYVMFLVQIMKEKFAKVGSKIRKFYLDLATEQVKHIRKICVTYNYIYME